jgi:hypothetical protein
MMFDGEICIEFGIGDICEAHQNPDHASIFNFAELKIKNFFHLELPQFVGLGVDITF